MSQANKIVGTAFLLMGITIISRFIGFIRDQIIAAYYGTSDISDVLFAAFTIPNLLITITGGALSAALIPMIIRLGNEQEEGRLKKLVSSMFTLTSLFMIGLSLLVFIFLEPIVSVYVMGWDADKKQMTQDMLEIVTPAFVIIGISSLFSAILNAHRHYLAPNLGPLLQSLGVIIATVFFAYSFGEEQLMTGIVLGLLAHLAFSYYVIRRKNITFQLTVSWNEDLRKAGILILPIFISTAAFQLNTVADKMMASGLPEGSVAALNYGNKVMQLPISIFVGAMVLPLFPMIADKLSKGDYEGTQVLLERSYRLIAILLLPVLGVFIVLAEPIIAVLFQRGEFDATSVQMTSTALIYYSFTLLPFAMRDVMTRAFYSMQDTWTPVLNSVIMVAINIGLMLILVPQFGMMGIAGSTSLSAMFAYIRMRYLLNKRMGLSKQKFVDKIWLHILLNATVFTLITWGIYQGLYSIFDNPTGIDLYLRFFISFIVGGVSYLFLTWRVKSEEVDWLKERVGKLMHSRRVS